MWALLSTDWQPSGPIENEATPSQAPCPLSVILSRFVWSNPYPAWRQFIKFSSIRFPFSPTFLLLLLLLLFFSILFFYQKGNMFPLSYMCVCGVFVHLCEYVCVKRKRFLVSNPLISTSLLSSYVLCVNVCVSVWVSKCVCVYMCVSVFMCVFVCLWVWDRKSVV